MLKAVFNRMIDRFERTWRYDATYMRHILRGSPASFLKFAVFTGVVDRKGAPAAALAAASIVGTVVEDCGPCTQISADIGAAAGVRPDILRAILTGDEAAMGEEALLAWRFARTSLARDLEAVEPLRDEIVRRWGDRGLVAIAFSFAGARVYPTLKYALGYGKECSRVTVGGRETPVAPLSLPA